MKPLYKFKIGSSVFFSEYSDYKSKDIDYIAIMDHFAFSDKIMIRCKIGNDDIFMYKPNISKQEFIDEVLNTNVSMKAGKFLSPEFVKYIRFTIEDLKRIKPIFSKIDKKHQYEKIICDSYIENNDFCLTDAQRLNAYNEYKKCH